jgi:hypothetical protein
MGWLYMPAYLSVHMSQSTLFPIVAEKWDTSVTLLHNNGTHDQITAKKTEGPREMTLLPDNCLGLERKNDSRQNNDLAYYYKNGIRHISDPQMTLVQ